MQNFTASEARANLYRLIDETAQSHEPIVITGKRSNAVLISADDWSAIQETLHLLSVPGMRESIKAGMAEPLAKSAKVGVFSATEGDDKAAKHPYIVRESNLLILNKIDLIEHVPFDLPLFRDDVRTLAKETPLLELSAHTGQNLNPWLDWLTSHVAQTTPETLAT